MIKTKTLIRTSSLAIGFACTLPTFAKAPDDSAVSQIPSNIPSRMFIESVDTDEARPLLPMLTLEQLPTEVRSRFGLPAGGISSQAVGTGGIPFTTAKASTETGAQRTIRQMPLAATGRLYVEDGAATCTASIIDKGLLVTAAHCVAEFGVDFYAGGAWFEPARNKGDTYYGAWPIVYMVVPSVYLDGTDVCPTPGIVCENDIAVLATAYNGGEIADVVGGYYGTANNNYGYVPDYPDTGRISAIITELGYPAALHNGKQMIRTDSLGEQFPDNQVVIGSDQSAGSSGGPWLVNFGTPITTRTTAAPDDNLPNQVVAVTSWGYGGSTDYERVKIQGASRFGNNTSFTTTTNIDVLHYAYACTDHPEKCY